MKRTAFLLPALGLALAWMPGAALAGPDAQAGVPPKKVTNLVVYGNDPCPTGTDGEIIVCAREPESERFRVPKRFREKKAEPAKQSWATRAQSIDDAARTQRPGSCSVVGSGGQTGCTAEMLRQWLEAKRAAAAEAGSVP